MFSVPLLNPQYEYNIKRKLVIFHHGPASQFTLCYPTIPRVSSILPSLIFVDLFVEESFVFQFAIQKSKDQDI